KLRHLQEGAQLARPLRRGARLHRLPRQPRAGGDAEGLGSTARWLGEAGQQVVDHLAQPAAAAQESRQRSGVDLAVEGISRADPSSGGGAARWFGERGLHRQRLQETVRTLTMPERLSKIGLMATIALWLALPGSATQLMAAGSLMVWHSALAIVAALDADSRSYKTAHEL